MFLREQVREKKNTKEGDAMPFQVIQSPTLKINSRLMTYLAIKEGYVNHQRNMLSSPINKLKLLGL